MSALNDGKRIIVNQGGTSSGKTWAILQLLVLIALRQTGWIISVVSESMPHLKRGAMRDFIKLLESERMYSDAIHNKTDHVFFIGKSMVEFFSADQDDKVRGARRDVLFLNECNNVTYYVYDQLEVRTGKYILLDYNPVSEFWAHDRVLPRPDAIMIRSTYLDNPFLSADIRRSIEARRQIDPAWWTVYGMGEVGRAEGIIFTNWQQVPGYPGEHQWEVLGLDFGFTNDPTALVRVCLSGGELFIDELIYSTHLTNSDISAKLKAFGIPRQEKILADAAEPKSIEEIYRAGYNIQPAPKGQDSVRTGIDVLKKYKLNVTQRSTNLIKELRNYHWQTNKEGQPINVPIDDYNHAIDAMRYAVTGQLSERGKILIAKVI